MNSFPEALMRASKVAPSILQDTTVKTCGSEIIRNALLTKLRWPRGVRCLRCGSSTVTAIPASAYRCRACRYRFTLTTGTVIHQTHLPLWIWVIAVYLLLVTSRGVSARQIAWVLGVTYKTAWSLCHRIRQSMDMTHAITSELAEPQPFHEINRDDASLILPRTVVNPYHPGSEKYLNGYLDEIAWRFNQRNNPRKLEATLRRLLGARPDLVRFPGAA